MLKEIKYILNSEKKIDRAAKEFIIEVKNWFNRALQINCAIKTSYPKVPKNIREKIKAKYPELQEESIFRTCISFSLFHKKINYFKVGIFSIYENKFWRLFIICGINESIGDDLVRDLKINILNSQTLRRLGVSEKDIKFSDLSKMKTKTELQQIVEFYRRIFKI